MKVRDKNCGKILFKDVIEGAVFKCGAGIFMKIPMVTIVDDDYSEVCVSAIHLASGNLRSFFPSEAVELLENAELVI